MDYRCITPCQYGGEIWQKGTILEFQGKPTYCTECPPEGVCVKCKGTKRLNPPRYFEPVGDVDEAAEREAAERDKDAVEEIREQMTAMGKAFDRRWGLIRLQKELIIAKKEKGE